MFRLLAQTLLNSDSRRFSGGEAGMKELGNNLAKLFFIIMFMITLAVSMAALSQWASPDANAENKGVAVEQGESAPALSASVSP